MMKKLGPGGEDEVRRFMGANHVAFPIQQAIMSCWMMLPNEKKTVDNLEKELRRIFERELENFRKDSESFGLGQGPPTK